LLGCYVEAALRAAGPTELPALRRELDGLLDGVLPEVDRQGLNHVSEVFDGEPPQRGSGTFAQAWNTGELLRARALLASWPGAGRP
jgi:glycogen debranching enzyme